jgi:hypothetical protein
VELRTVRRGGLRRGTQSPSPRPSSSRALDDLGDLDLGFADLAAAEVEELGGAAQLSARRPMSISSPSIRSRIPSNSRMASPKLGQVGRLAYILSMECHG